MGSISQLSFFYFMHLLHFDKIWMKVWDRSDNSVFFHSFTYCRTIFQSLDAFSLWVFFPFRLNCTFTFRGVHFFTVLLRFLKLLSPFWFLNSLLKEFTANWNYIQSVFFSTTILTTIGKNKKNYGKCMKYTTALTVSGEKIKMFECLTCTTIIEKLIISTF